MDTRVTNCSNTHNISLSLGQVNYMGKSVSDPLLREKLCEISAYLGLGIVVTSGDRKQVVNGNGRSLHLQGKAVDFYVEGSSLEEAFAAITESGLIDQGFEFIYHTEVTISPHLHLGRFSNLQKSRFIVDQGQILPLR